jgi:hypothetical protein
LARRKTSTAIPRPATRVRRAVLPGSTPPRSWSTRSTPTLLLRAGVRATHLWADRLTLSVFGYNLLDDRTSDPDFYFEDRVQSRPQPKGGFSVFGQAQVTF